MPGDEEREPLVRLTLAQLLWRDRERFAVWRFGAALFGFCARASRAFASAPS